MLGESHDSDSNDDDEEEDEVERLFRKAHADERKFMLDKSRVGPVRALERATSDDEDHDVASLATPRRRKKPGYLPSNLNDTSNVQVSASASVSGRKKTEKTSTSRRQSLDDMLFNVSGPSPGYLGCSASVGYNGADSDSNFASSVSVPGDILARKTSSTVDWTKNVDELLDARRRSHTGESPRSHKDQVRNTGAVPAAIVSASYASKMRQLQSSRAYRIGGALKPGSSSHASSSQSKTSNLVLPLITEPSEAKKRINPLGLRRPTMI
jgi:hypothetical protein